MDAQDLITGIRWELLQLLSKEPQTGADLARLLGTSAPNISQHLKLLELAGIIHKERVNGKSMHYRINQETALITLLAFPQAVRSAVPLEGMRGAELRLFLEDTAQAKYVRRFLMEYEELTKLFIAFGTVHDGSHDIQLLVLTSDVKPFRKEYANIQVQDRKIIIWSHTPEEFREGLSRNEHYFKDLLKSLNTYYDPLRMLHKYQEEYK